MVNKNWGSTPVSNFSKFGQPSSMQDMSGMPQNVIPGFVPTPPGFVNMNKQGGFINQGMTYPMPPNFNNVDNQNVMPSLTQQLNNLNLNNQNMFLQNQLAAGAFMQMNGGNNNLTPDQLRLILALQNQSNTNSGIPQTQEQAFAAQQFSAMGGMPPMASMASMASMPSMPSMPPMPSLPSMAPVQASTPPQAPTLPQAPQAPPLTQAPPPTQSPVAKPVPCPSNMSELTKTFISSMKDLSGKGKSTGILKFFNEGKGFGFFVNDDDGKDVFFHYEDVKDMKISKDFLREAKNRYIVKFAYTVQVYYGKYSYSTKAIDIDLLGVIDLRFLSNSDPTLAS
mmetsp:Transcript_20889/g.23237  ORF Transcript_20889/g.23237 Transcript_20889/m.23237 type:complete len:338 (-) Transcript_20889:149-1162(-)